MSRQFCGDTLAHDDQEPWTFGRPETHLLKHRNDLKVLDGRHDGERPGDEERPGQRYQALRLLVAIVRARQRDGQRRAFGRLLGSVEGQAFGVLAPGWRESPWRIAGSEKVGPDLISLGDIGHIPDVQARCQVGMLKSGQLEAARIGFAEV
jgi:hypothetical protein